MSVLITELMKSMQNPNLKMPYGLIEGTLNELGQVKLEKGFYFLLVTNGTATVSDIYRDYTVSAGSLLILTPSLRATLVDMGSGFSLLCLYIEPDYYDTLSVGELVYNQVSSFVGNYRLPCFQLDEEQMDILCRTLSLFADRLDGMQLYRDGAIRHLCSFFLLQTADALYQKNCEISGCYANRSTEIFRSFKRLLVHHYRQQHTIHFYADQLNISTTYLSRVVKRITSHTVCFHISELLLADARKLLECTDQDVKEIADKLGFSDQSVFGKFFMRKTGMSPVKFRQRGGKSVNKKKLV